MKLNKNGSDSSERFESPIEFFLLARVELEIRGLGEVPGEAPEA